MIKLGNFSKRQRIAAAVISLALILVGGGLFLTSALALKEPEKNPEITRETPFTNPLAKSIPTPSEKDMEIILKNLEIIESSPAISSRPGDYIAAHRKEYDEIVNMGDSALMELFIMFEKGGETGLRGHLMAALCRDIIGSSYTSDKLAETGQKWYDNYRDDMLPLRGTEKYPEKHKVILYSVVDSYGYTKIPNFLYPGDDPLLKLVYQTLTDDAIKIKMKTREADFLVVAPHIFKSVEEENRLKVFVTAYIGAFGLLDGVVEKGSASIVPYAITYEKNSNGEYILLKTEPSGDGSLFRDSIRDFCTYPVSGKKISGLADEIIGHYRDYSDIMALREENLKACLRASGIVGTIYDEKGNVVIVL